VVLIKREGMIAGDRVGDRFSHASAGREQGDADRLVGCAHQP
jgi:hypothetical protein